MAWNSTLLNQLLEGDNLALKQVEDALDDIMGGHWTAAQISAFLVALRAKGETIEEIAGAARSMRRFSERVEGAEDALDIVGTGGDGAGSLNISTAASFVACGAGAKIAKHGNRSVSSKCGSADVLEALGAVIDLSAEATTKVLNQCGYCFMFAPVHHPSMRHVAPVRRELGVRTVFNLLGPLTSPASVEQLVVGVYHRDLVEPMAFVLKFLGAKNALVVHGQPGIDEISISGQTWAALVKNGDVETLSLLPSDFGLDSEDTNSIVGGDAAANAQSIRAILAGENHPARSVVLINAAAGIRIAGLAEDWSSACSLAQSSIAEGNATAALDKWVEATRSAGH